jgi:DeoR/GlpR family transcriptional regulator of sugar metabolism
VAELLHERGGDGLTVILTGGVRTPSNALVGPVAVAALRSLHVDTLFLGVHGIDDRAGLTTPNLVEAETDRALVACARRVVVCADHSKWGVVGLSSIADLAQVDVLVTDDALDPATERVLSQRIGRLVVAPSGEVEDA